MAAILIFEFPLSSSVWGWGCLKNREVSAKRPGLLRRVSKKEPKIRKSQ